jgi:hypothetical protein
MSTQALKSAVCDANNPAVRDMALSKFKRTHDSQFCGLDRSDGWVSNNNFMVS